MLVETSLAALASGEQVALVPGDTLRVTCSFSYTVAEAITVTLWGALGIGLGRDIENFKQISLEASTTPKTWSGDIDIPIPTSGKNNGTYWLQVEVQGYDLGSHAGQKIEGAVVISGMPEVGDIFKTIGNLVTMMIVMMMMEMMMGMMDGMFPQAGAPPTPKPVTEAVVKTAKKVGPYVGKAIKAGAKYVEERYLERGEEES